MNTHSDSANSTHPIKGKVGVLHVLSTRTGSILDLPLFAPKSFHSRTRERERKRRKKKIFAI